MYIYTIYVYLYTQCIYTYVYTSHPLDPNWTLNQWGVGGRIEHGAHVWILQGNPGGGRCPRFPGFLNSFFIFQGDPGGGRCPKFPGLSLAMCVHISTSAYMYIPKSVGCTYMCPSVYMYIRNLYVSMCEIQRERERQTHVWAKSVYTYVRGSKTHTHTHTHTHTNSCTDVDMCIHPCTCMYRNLYNAHTQLPTKQAREVSPSEYYSKNNSKFKMYLYI